MSVRFTPEELEYFARALKIEFVLDNVYASPGAKLRKLGLAYAGEIYKRGNKELNFPVVLSPVEAVKAQLLKEMKNK